MIAYGPWSYTYDSANCLVSVSSNDVLLVTNYYDAKSRRVRKVTSEATTTFFYDDWNLVEEHIAYTNGTVSTIHYYWGKDLSGTFQGAGGVGGLLYVTVDGAVYIPCYDNNGNITRYLDASGNVVAAYIYDAFGHTISQNGPLADVFRHRFSTKYFDIETGFYYYGYRFYSPIMRRWLSRDPCEELTEFNLYSFCMNGAVFKVDHLGCFTVEFVSKLDEKKKIHSVEDIPIDDSYILIGAYGAFSMGEVSVRNPNFNKECAVVSFPLIIKISAGKLSHEKNERVGYDEHFVMGNRLCGGIGDNDVKGAVLQHEKGHARAFWENIKPEIESFCYGLSDSDFAAGANVEGKILSYFNQLLKLPSYLNLTSDYANSGTMNFYRNGYRKLLLPLMPSGKVRNHVWEKK